MADKYIDKIKYSDRYFLLDSGAIHDSNHKLSGTTSNFKSNGTIVAEQGLFNKLIATNASISSLDVNNLTAQNATVVGLLDVQGQLKTNSWTNSNIATIEGNFFIAPTLGTGSSLTTGTTKLTISKTNNIWEITIAGSFLVNQIGADPVSASDTDVNQWSTGSKVLITGEIAKDDGIYPLGTLKGVIKNTPTMDSITGIATSINITNITDNLGNTEILDILGVGSYYYRNIKISLTQRKYGSSNVESENMRPIGILMSAQGRSSKSFIDIYGGANKLEEGAILGADSDYGGLAIPNVRIGNLRGLPSVGNQTPTGWGIYTDNGYFKGTIVANTGEIGRFIIANDLYSGQLGQEESVWISAGTNDAAAIGGINRNISGWAFTAGNKFGVTKDGDLYASNVTINGSITITGDDSNIYTRNEVDDITETSIKDIEKIINIEDWLQEYGSYILTEDTIAILHKNYFADEYRLSEDTTIYEYNLVENPTGNPQTQNWYELNGDEYIATSDTIVQEDKQYYTRTNNKTYYTRSGESEPYEYTPVSPEPDDSPTSNGWYEIVKVQVIPTVNPSLQEYYQLNSQTWSVTLDTVVDVDKQYFERFERDDEPGSYYYVPINADIHDNPSEKQWYELTNDTYIQSPDTTLENHKLYFSQIIQDNIISYKPIMEHIPNPSILNLYELDNVKYSISNYIASHVKLKNNAIIIQADNTKACVHISLNGIVLKDNDGTPVASFAKDIILGNKSEMHLELSPGNSNTLPELGFYDGNTKVAYVNSNTLNINQGEIKEKLRIGQFEWRTQGANRISLIYAPISS